MISCPCLDLVRVCGFVASATVKYYNKRTVHQQIDRFLSLSSMRSHSVLFDFKDIPSDVKSKLMDTYCLDLYSSQLWKYSKNDVNAFYIAWRKAVRRIWKIPSTTHSNLSPVINKSLPIEILMEKRCDKFI